jgi:hypothetical protein
MTTAKVMALDEVLLQMRETTSSIAAASAGYRAQLEASGFSPTASEVMAMKYHDILLNAAFGALKK